MGEGPTSLAVHSRAQTVAGRRRPAIASLGAGTRGAGSDTGTTTYYTTRSSSVQPTEPSFSTVRTDTLVGRTLSRYRVLSEIGRGGMGIVYRAFDDILERELALKVLPSGRVADRRWRRRFLQEARTVAALECPYICVILEPQSAVHSRKETPPRRVALSRAGGTPSHMSPEQVCGLALDPRSDIFAFGVLLHEMLTGANPFQHRTCSETQDAILNDPVPSLELIDAACGVSGMRRVLDRCLAKAPRDRYQDMGELLADLGKVRLKANTAMSSRWAAHTAPLTSLCVGLVGLAGVLAALSRAN